MASRFALGDAGAMDHEPGWHPCERDPVSALALMLLGGQTSAILQNVSGSV